MVLDVRLERGDLRLRGGVVWSVLEGCPRLLQLLLERIERLLEPRDAVDGRVRLMAFAAGSITLSSPRVTSPCRGIMSACSRTRAFFPF